MLKVTVELRLKIDRVEGEKWRWLKGYRNRYLISNKLRVYSMGKDRLLSPVINSNRLVVINISGKTVSVARLVKETFGIDKVTKSLPKEKSKNKVTDKLRTHKQTKKVTNQLPKKQTPLTYEQKFALLTEYNQSLVDYFIEDEEPTDFELERYVDGLLERQSKE